MCYLDSIIATRMGAALVIYFHLFIRDVRKFAYKWAQFHFLYILMFLTILPNHYNLNIPDTLPEHCRLQIYSIQWQHFFHDIIQQQRRLLSQFHMFNTNLSFWKPFFLDSEFRLICQQITDQFTDSYKQAQQHFNKRILWHKNHKLNTAFNDSNSRFNSWFWTVRSFPPYSTHIKPPNNTIISPEPESVETWRQQPVSDVGIINSTDNNPTTVFPILSQDKWVINLSNQSFTASQLQLLKLGFNYALQPSSPPFFQCYQAVEQLITNCGNEVNASVLRTKLTNILKSFKPDKFNSQIIQAKRFLSTLKKQNKTIILRSDKGNSTVIMDKLEYTEKMTQYLHTPGLFKTLKSDPASSIIKDINQQLKSLKSSKQVDTDFYNKSLAHKSQFYPNLFAQVKVHKEHNPLRPIVNGSNNPTTNLARMLLNVMEPLKQFCSNSVRDSYKAKDLITSLTIQPTAKIATVDVVNMYNSLPHDLILQAIQYFLSTYKQHLTLNPDTILNLVKLVISNSYCTFEKKFYKQLHGLPMGGCLSPLLADLTMSFFEYTHLKFSTSGLSIWIRYVDDAFIVFNGTSRQLSNFIAKLNMINSNIQFTIQHENNNSVDFLDLTVHKVNNKLLTSLFFKTTFTGRYLDFTSQHHTATKKGIAIGLFRRAFRLTTHQTLLPQTLDYISSILRLNQYPDKLIKTALILAQKENTNKSSQQANQKWHALPYLKNVSERIASTLKSLNLKLSFKPVDTIASIYYSPGIPKDRFQTRACVYAVPCSCGNWYIGETGRTLKQRITEHKYFTKPQHAGDPELKYKSAIAKHFHSTNHHIQWDGTRIIAIENNTQTRKLIEAFFIKKFNPSLNISPGVDIEPQWFFLLSKQYDLTQFTWLQAK